MRKTPMISCQRYLIELINNVPFQNAPLTGSLFFIDAINKQIQNHISLLICMRNKAKKPHFLIIIAYMIKLTFTHLTTSSSFHCTNRTKLSRFSQLQFNLKFFFLNAQTSTSNLEKLFFVMRCFYKILVLMDLISSVWKNHQRLSKQLLLEMYAGCHQVLL